MLNLGNKEDSNKLFNLHPKECYKRVTYSINEFLKAL